MGVGKTSIGKKLSKQLNWKFLDTDKLIEKKIGLPIPEIFNQLGEDFFREQEREILNEISSLENVVVSVGGGLPCFFDNMERLNKIGTTVYLKLEPEFIVQRLLESKIKRPLIDNLSQTQLEQFVISDQPPKHNHLLSPVVDELPSHENKVMPLKREKEKIQVAG